MFLLLIASPLLFGISDYWSGQMSKRLNPWAVIGVTCAISAVGSLIWGLAFHALVLDSSAIVRGAASGLLLMTAYALFYKALALGKGGVVGSIVTLSVIIPVISDAFHGDLPSTPSLLGILAIVGGVILISQQDSSGQQSRTSILLALAAAAIFGLQYLVLGQASAVSSDTAVLSQFIAATIAIAVVGLVTRSTGGATSKDIPQLAGIGVLFLFASLCFSESLVAFNVAIASAFVNTEPIVLAILGLVLMREKLSAGQWIALIVVIGGAAAAMLFD